MREVFFGAWNVVVTAKDADFSERYVIRGSDQSDGAYDGVPGTGPGRVEGEEWSIEMEWNNNVDSGWRPSGVARTQASFDVIDGLQVTLGADDNDEPHRDGDFNDMFLTLTSLDPGLQPLPGGPPEYTLPD